MAGFDLSTIDTAGIPPAVIARCERNQLDALVLGLNGKIRWGNNDQAPDDCQELLQRVWIAQAGNNPWGGNMAVDPAEFDEVRDNVDQIKRRLDASDRRTRQQAQSFDQLRDEVEHLTRRFDIAMRGNGGPPPTPPAGGTTNPDLEQRIHDLEQQLAAQGGQSQPQPVHAYQVSKTLLIAFVVAVAVSAVITALIMAALIIYGQVGRNEVFSWPALIIFSALFLPLLVVFELWSVKPPQNP